MNTQRQTQQKAGSAPTSSFIPVRSGLLQRKCACGNHVGGGGECAECRQKLEGMLQRVAVNADSINGMPPIMHEVLRASGQPLDTATRAFMEPRFEYDFSGVQVHSDVPQSLQTNLTVNRPGDEYEQEAGRIAEQVIRIPKPHVSTVEQANGAEPIVQRSPITSHPSPARGERSAVPPIVHDVVRSSGEPLDATTRAFMEPRFGQARVDTE